MAIAQPTHPRQLIPSFESRNIALALLVAMSLGFALRYASLEARPMHNDEAVNGIKFGRLWEQGDYKYDPNEHHGPTLYYATLALAELTKAPDLNHFTEARLRVLTVLFGLGMILLLPLIADGLGQKGTIWSAIFTSVSPAFVFYSRYYIHEMLLVFFAFLTLVAGWRYWRSRKIWWALLAGIGLGLMHATKETFVITLAAAALALVLNQIWNRLLDGSGSPVPARRLNLWHVTAAIVIWLVVAVVLFSSFFKNPSGPVDSLRTYGPWLSRAGGESEHIHSWSFYFHRLLWFHVGKGPVWTEALIAILALIGGVTCFLRKNLGRSNASFGRFIALYTLILTAGYTLISYKTPWCLLNFWHGTILLAGLGAAFLLRSTRRIRAKVASALALSLGVAHLGWQAFQESVPFAADQRNPYVYAQTAPDVPDLVKQVERLAKTYPAGNQMLIKVMAPDSDYWPLPWYLRSFKNVGWWDNVPADPWAPVMIVSAKFKAALDEQKTHLMVRYFALRPQVLVELYVQADLWRAYLARMDGESDAR